MIGLFFIPPHALVNENVAPHVATPCDAAFLACIATNRHFKPRLNMFMSALTLSKYTTRSSFLDVWLKLNVEIRLD